MAMAVTAIPLARADVTTRTTYLRRVSAISVVGLLTAAIAGFLSAGAIAAVPMLHNQWAALGIILVSYGISNYVARGMVFSDSPPTKWIGFFLGAGFQGVAMGYLLLAAIVVSAQATGSALLLIGEAMGLTALSAVGITAYLWSGPRELSYVRAGLSALFLPMLVLMAISFVFPIGGPIGIALAAIFVVVSVGGLLYSMNQVLYALRSDMHVEGAFLVTMGLLVLFWNILSLLLRLQDRR